MELRDLRADLPGSEGLAPKYVTTMDQVGRAMLRVVRRGYKKHVLESDDINRV